MLTGPSSNPLSAKQPSNDERGDWVRKLVDDTPALQLIGATLTRIEPGQVEVEMTCHPEVCQQHGFVHGGILGLLADVACMSASLTLTSPGTVSVSVEYKISLLEPAVGERVVARGRVIRPGHTLSFAAADLYAVERGGGERLIATATATLAALTPRPRRRRRSRPWRTEASGVSPSPGWAR
jgi:uncharacterized protein (TIGR00369 family)